MRASAQHNDPAIFITLRDEADAIAEAKALARRRHLAAALRRAVRREGQHRRRRPADHGGVPGLRLHAEGRRDLRRRGCAPRARSPSARPISTSSPPASSACARPMACRATCSTRSSSRAARAPAPASRSRPGSCRSRSAPTRRAPAACRPALGNIVGLKPSLGMVSTAGAVPACRTLDCISVFALTVDDAWAAFAAMAGPDIADPITRNRPRRRARPGAAAAHRRADQGRARVLRRSGLGRRIRGRDRALRKARRDGQRDRHRAVLRDRAPALRRPVGRRALSRGAEADRLVAGVDASGHARDHPGRRARDTRPMPSRRSTSSRTCAACAITCSARSTCCWCRPCRPSTRSSRCWPIRSSSTAGSAPTPISSTCSTSAASRCRRACGRTARRSASRCWRRAAAMRCSPRSAACFTPTPNLPLGATGAAAAAARAALTPRRSAGEIALAVVGAHLSGMPLNGELKSFGARFLEAAQTAPDYRLFALNDDAAAAARPAARRGRTGRRRSRSSSGRCRPRASAASSPRSRAPLSIGTLTLADGRSVKGFLAEASGVEGARDISRFGGWRAFVAQM